MEKVNLEAFQAAKRCIFPGTLPLPVFPTFDQLEVGSNTRALVLVPHVDDEIMGCGGTMCRIGKCGAHMKVVYMSGSAHEHNKGCTDHLTRMDRGETDVALRTLRCYDSELIDPDLRTVRCDDQSLVKLSKILNHYEPDMVFVPCFDESRPDYIKTAAIAAKALESYPYNAECYCYSFEGVRGPNALVDITLTIEDKIEAMKERHTQRKVVDDEENIRSMHLFSYSTRTNDRYCERFNRYHKDSYVGMARDLGLLGMID